VANTVGFLKGNSAVRIHREYLGQKRNFTGLHFWARGYCVSTVRLDKQIIRDYIRNQEAEETVRSSCGFRAFGPFHLHAGQKFAIIPKGDTIVLAPIRRPNEARGLLKGAHPSDYRDRGDRLDRNK